MLFLSLFGFLAASLFSKELSSCLCRWCHSCLLPAAIPSSTCLGRKPHCAASCISCCMIIQVPHTYPLIIPRVDPQSLVVITSSSQPPCSPLPIIKEKGGRGRMELTSRQLCCCCRRGQAPSRIITASHHILQNVFSIWSFLCGPGWHCRGCLTSKYP